MRGTVLSLFNKQKMFIPFFCIGGGLGSGVGTGTLAGWAPWLVNFDKGSYKWGENKTFPEQRLF